MTRAGSATRNGLAFGLSAFLHLALVLILLFDQTLPYELPTPPTPPIEMEIEPIPEPITVPAPTPPIQPPIALPAVSPPPIPKPPVIIKVRPVAAAQATQPAPPVAREMPTATFTPMPTPVITPAPTPSETVAPAAVAAPAIPRLNIHKPEKQAPAGVPTLPMAPSPAQRPTGAQPLGEGEPGAGSSRLKGLTPFSYGPMPSGGPGLRGSLVGCANAEAVALSAVERAHCNERFGVDAAKSPGLDMIPRDKRAAFDKSADRQNSWKAYRDSVPANGTPPGPNGMGRLGPLQPQGLIQDVMPHN